MDEEIKKDTCGRNRVYVHFKCDNPRCDKWHWKQKRYASDKNFCSKKCANYFRGIDSRVESECALCGKKMEIGKFKFSLSKSGLHFCCRNHKDIAQRIESGMTALWPSHFGTGVRVLGTDYRVIAFRRYPKKCNRCGYDRVISILEIHHRDRDRNNSSIDNLEVLCPNCHQEEHYAARDGRFSRLSEETDVELNRVG